MKIRHPEKVNNPINLIKKKPDWIRSKLTNTKEFFLTKTIINSNNLVTVCQEANCPNITECWSKRHATFMIMGDTCTRACGFCDVKTGKPAKLDPLEMMKSDYLDELHPEYYGFKKDDYDKSIILNGVINRESSTIRETGYVDILLFSERFADSRERSLAIRTDKGLDMDSDDFKDGWELNIFWGETIAKNINKKLSNNK